MIGWLTAKGHGLFKGSSTPKSLPRVSGAMPVFGHSFSLGDNAIGLLQRGKREVGESFVVHGPQSPITVVMEPLALGDVPELQPIAQLNRALDGSHYWASGWRHENLWSPWVETIIKNATLRLQVERVVSAVESLIQSWPDSGERLLAPAMAELSATATLAAIWSEAPQPLVQELMAESQTTPGWASKLAFAVTLPKAPQLRRDPWQRAIKKAFAQAKRSPAQAARDRDLIHELANSNVHHSGSGRRIKDSEAAEFFLSLAQQITWHGMLSSISVLKALGKEPPWLEPVLEEQDRVHGDQGDPTFETLRAATVLENVLEEIESKAPIRRLILGRLMAPWRLNASIVPAGTKVLLDRKGLYPQPRWTKQDRVENRLSRLLLKAIWSVLWRELELNVVGKNAQRLHFKKRDY